jgi:hypothetical protein
MHPLDAETGVMPSIYLKVYEYNYGVFTSIKYFREGVFYPRAALGVGRLIRALGSVVPGPLDHDRTIRNHVLFPTSLSIAALRLCGQVTSLSLSHVR